MSAPKTAQDAGSRCDRRNSVGYLDLTWREVVPRASQAQARAGRGGGLILRGEPSASPRCFGTGGKALSGLGDAGATPVALAVQPEGKILAAGLVFFQVPSGTATPFNMTLASAAALSIVSVLFIAVVIWRARST